MSTLHPAGNVNPMVGGHEHVVTFRPAGDERHPWRAHRLECVWVRRVRHGRRVTAQELVENFPRVRLCIYCHPLRTPVVAGEPFP